VSENLLEVENLDVTYHTDEGGLPALQDLSLSVRPGEILGVVGESGCGKSTLSAALMRLLPPNGEITKGDVIYGGRYLRELGEEEMRGLRGSELAMIFQDPLTSLNPTFTIGTQMEDVQRAHRAAGVSNSDLRHRAIEMLERVGIPDAKERLDSYPHEFSGGMRQRIMIAMALMLKPSLLIADEPTTALDVTLEVQILQLLKELCAEEGTAIIFISHDLGVISQICDRVLVMYAGRAVEEADVVSLFERPLHPYTQALLASIPSRKRRGKRLASIPGRVPSLYDLPHGCRFADRCPHFQEVNREQDPRYLEIEGRRVRCNAYDPESGYMGVRTIEHPLEWPEGT
jgi:peptide/nickel transport system ATP-binding protein